MADVTIQHEGTIVLFDVESDEAQDWWGENVQEGMTYCGSYVIEHRYAPAIFNGLTEAGFEVEIN